MKKRPGYPPEVRERAVRDSILSNISNLCFAAALMIGSTSQAFEFDEMQDDDVYFSPTRLKQSLHDVPASVSKITSETISALQFKNVPELLRHVAGMVSTKAAGNDYRINYHGTNGLIPRRMQVLVDGISLYRPSYAFVAWSAMPVSINDIDYIEVTRSPSAASYGANSMMAVINIRTKNPLAMKKLGVTIGTGSFDTRDANLFGSGEINDNVQFRYSFSREENDGFDLNAAGDERRDSLKVDRFNSNLYFDLGPKTSADVFVAYTDSNIEVEYRDSGQITAPDFDTQRAHLKVDIKHTLSSNHDIKFKTFVSRTDEKFYWDTCYPAISFSSNLKELYSLNPSYAQAIVASEVPTGGTAEENALRDAVLTELFLAGPAALSPVCGTVDENGYEETIAIELQDTIIFSEKVRAVSGIGISRQTLNAETFLTDRVENEGYQIFGNIEYRMNPLVFNFGGMFEDQNIGNVGVLFSPRLGVNYRVNDGLTIKSVLSQAKRTPDILETSANWNYYMRNMSPTNPVTGTDEGYFYVSARGNEDLDPEEILAREISLYYRDIGSFDIGTVENILDVKFFKNDLTNLISEKLEYLNFNPTNDGEVTLSGFEVEYEIITRSPLLNRNIEKIHTHFNYSYVDSDTDEYFESSLHAQHVGGFFMIVSFNNEWFGSISYTGHSSIAGETSDVFELGAGKTLKFADEYSLQVKGKAVYEPDTDHQFVDELDRNVESINKDGTGFYLTLTFSKD